MAKRDVFKEASKAGLVPEGAAEEDYTEAQLLTLLGRGPAWEGSVSSKEPLTAPDGHQTLTKEDIDNRG